MTSKTISDKGKENLNISKVLKPPKIFVRSSPLKSKFKTSEEIETELYQAEKSFGIESELYMRERDKEWLSKGDYEKRVEELKIKFCRNKKDCGKQYPETSISKFKNRLWYCGICDLINKILLGEE